jgi:ABC-type transporter Mla maintaining outer membrane lipid asymmetry permease subunit MlaE
VERPLRLRLGRAIAGALEATGAVALFGARAFGDAFRRPYELTEIFRQLVELGVRSAPLVAVAGMAVGVVLSMHTRSSLERFGAESMIPAGLALALVRETGPLTAGLLLSGRIITGMSFELYFRRAFSLVEFADYVPSTIKTMCFGFLIATISSYLGFTTERGTEGVGRASTRSVVFSSLLIIVANVVLVKIIFFLIPSAQ